MTKRKRGRPPAGPEEKAATRRRLLDATRSAFSQVGYHKLTVELIATEASLSRPTFYKHFPNVDAAIEVVIKEVNVALINRLMGAAGSAQDPFVALDAIIVAWRDWGTDLGEMLGPLFAELHDPHSPASAERQRTLATFGQALKRMLESMGRPTPTQLQVDALLNGVEYLGYRFHLDTPAGPGEWKATRDAMIRLALGLMGTADDWARAIEIAESLGVALGSSLTEA